MNQGLWYVVPVLFSRLLTLRQGFQYGTGNVFLLLLFRYERAYYDAEKNYDYMARTYCHNISKDHRRRKSTMRCD